MSVFGGHRFRFWKKTLGKTCSAFGTKWFRFGAKLAWCLDWLETKLKSHKFGFRFSRFSLGVSKTSQPVASWKGKPTNFDVEPGLC